MSILRYIHHDQLSESISCLQGIKTDDVILMIECRSEFSRVKHHKKKIAFWISAMRHFANELKNSGFNVLYVKCNDNDNTGSFLSEIKRQLSFRDYDSIVVTKPSEWRVYSDTLQWQKN